MARLMVSTWSLVDATTATLRPVWWWSIQVAAMPVEVVVEGAGDDPAVRLVGVEGAWVTGIAAAATRRLPRGG